MSLWLIKEHLPNTACCASEEDYLTREIERHLGGDEGLVHDYQGVDFL